MALLDTKMIDEIRAVAERYSEREYERRRMVSGDTEGAPATPQAGARARPARGNRARQVRD